MKASYSFYFVFTILLILPLPLHSLPQRRILHQPLFPVTPESPSPPPPPPTPQYPDPDQPFFPEVPGGSNNPQQQSQSTPSPPVVSIPANGLSTPIPTATQPTKPAKKVAVAVSVGIVTLGMLSALAFFMYRHRKRHPVESEKLVGPQHDSRRFDRESRAMMGGSSQPSNFLYIGTVEPADGKARSSGDGDGIGTSSGEKGSPYQKLNSIKMSERYRPSPELQPLPPLPRPPPIENSDPPPISPPSSSEDEEEIRDTRFNTPKGSSINNAGCHYTPVSRQNNQKNAKANASSSSVNNSAPVAVPHSKRTSSKSRLSASSPEMKQVVVPSMKQAAGQPPVSPLPFQAAATQRTRSQESPLSMPSPPKRPKFADPPPPPNRELLQSITSWSQRMSGARAAPTPPPPPPPPPAAFAASAIPRKLENSEANGSFKILKESAGSSNLWAPNTKASVMSRRTCPTNDNSAIGGSLERHNVDDSNEGRPRMKPLHWDKVRATSDRATVWDQLKSSSFQLNEDMMETLFGCNSASSGLKEAARRPVLPQVDKENRVLDPKKSQNIAILLRALNVTRDEVTEALLDGNPENLGSELLETLIKMAPTKEEEVKLQAYNEDFSRLGSAERFLKAVLDIPFAFKRVEAMLYRVNFDTEVKYLRKSFQTLEIATEELRNSRLFLKLLEAVLRTGNRMNVGTNRGDAKAFKLDTLLKLVDIKGTDGKTTLLHFVVQEIIRTEGENTDSDQNFSILKEDDFGRQGLQVVAGLSRDLGNVKKAAGMDSDVLHSYVVKLEMGLEKVRNVLKYEKPGMPGKFFSSMKAFLYEAEDDITRIKEEDKKALLLVKEVTEYFHGDAGKEEAHPFRIFVIMRDFLSVLDHVCKDVGMMQERTMIGSSRSFRISSTASLPVLNRYNIRDNCSSDEESSSP